jgi:hypothetical protein
MKERGRAKRTIQLAYIIKTILRIDVKNDKDCSEASQIIPRWIKITPDRPNTLCRSCSCLSQSYAEKKRKR